VPRSVQVQCIVKVCVYDRRVDATLAKGHSQVEGIFRLRFVYLIQDGTKQVLPEVILDLPVVHCEREEYLRELFNGQRVLRLLNVALNRSPEIRATCLELAEVVGSICESLHAQLGRVAPEALFEDAYCLPKLIL